VKIKAVGGITCRVGCLHSKLVRCPVLIKHGSFYLYKSPVLPFGHPILSKSIGRALMIDPFIIKEVFYLSVFELGAIITSNFFDLDIKLILYRSQRTS
jgi:hypothetical protein